MRIRVFGRCDFDATDVVAVDLFEGYHHVGEGRTADGGVHEAGEPVLERVARVATGLAASQFVVVGQADRFAAVVDADEERAAVRVHEAAYGFYDLALYRLIFVALVLVPAGSGLELYGAALAGCHELFGR